LSRTLLRPGHVYERFTLASGKKVTVRLLRWEDLDSLLLFINSLVEEKRGDSKSGLYTGFDGKVTREEEAKWLAETLVAVEGGDVVDTIAEIGGKVIANGEVERGRYKDTHRHGHVGLTMLRQYRGQGIGRRMIETLVRESRRIGLRSLEAEFLADNETARQAYEKAGFKQAGIIPRKIFRKGIYFDGLIMAREL
jgi:RimJ/RimL family protein N-acetyltransferase